MSSNNLIKSKIPKCQTKSKKKKEEKFIFNLNKIEGQNYSRSCEKLNIRNEDFNDIKITNDIFVIRNLDDLEILPLKNIDYIFSAWKSTNLIFENFEKKIFNKKDFEINFETFDIITKNEKACDELKDEQFWILYNDYLIKNNKIKNSNDFLKSINNAFSYLEMDCRLLIVYYLEKIKIFHPIKINGEFEDKDEPYIDLLDSKVRNRIYNLKHYLTSDIKINNSNQKYQIKKHSFYEYTPIRKKNKKIEL